MNPQQPQQPTGAQPEPLRPVAYDANNQPLYAAPPVDATGMPQTAATLPPQPAQSTQPAPAPAPQSRAQQFDPSIPLYAPQSHVTAAPQASEGQNFDPRMRSQYANEPRVVHHERSYEPDLGEMSEELRAKHDKSVRMYPNLNLSEGEFVVLNIKRHLIGIVIPTVATVASIFVLMAALIAYPMLVESSVSSMPGVGLVTLVLLCLIILVGIGGYIAVWVYLQNTFYLTNESVIQEIQHGVFSKHEQTVSLGSIEDASFKQYGIIQSLFNYGTIRLSTEGEETTYRFQYVSNPKDQIAIVNNAIEAFKNGRPVVGDINEDSN